MKPKTSTYIPGGDYMEANALQLSWDAGKIEVQKKLSEFVQYFQINLPRNIQGIPLQLIDPTVILQATVGAETTDDVDEDALRAATTNIDFSEGFPTIGGLPIWERLDGELIDYYKLFKEYREMKLLYGSRSLARLSETHGISGIHLNYLFFLKRSKQDPYLFKFSRQLHPSLSSFLEIFQNNSKSYPCPTYHGNKLSFIFNDLCKNNF